MVSPARRFLVHVPHAVSASKCEIDRPHNEEIREQDVPRWALAKEPERDDGEDDERDALLHDLELGDRECPRTDAVRGDLERVLRQRDKPTHQDHQQQWLGLQLQVSIPRQGHEDIRDHE